APTSGAVNFAYKCTDQTATTYKIEATGDSAKGMSGFSYTVDQDNAKTSSYDGGTTVNCWVTSKSGSC
ncbi:MAG TPA: pilus assembly protein PilE, partial [Methylophilaceae bacterium]|nr:pilus assembly protein PilE [Methylophilaceae bacterium]